MIYANGAIPLMLSHFGRGDSQGAARRTLELELAVREGISQADV